MLATDDALPSRGADTLGMLNDRVLDLLHEITNRDEVWVRTVSAATFKQLRQAQEAADGDNCEVWVSAHAC